MPPSLRLSKERRNKGRKEDLEEEQSSFSLTPRGSLSFSRLRHRRRGHARLRRAGAYLPRCLAASRHSGSWWPGVRSSKPEQDLCLRRLWRQEHLICSGRRFLERAEERGGSSKGQLESHCSNPAASAARCSSRKKSPRRRTQSRHSSIMDS